MVNTLNFQMNDSVCAAIFIGRLPMEVLKIIEKFNTIKYNPRKHTWKYFASNGHIKGLEFLYAKQKCDPLPKALKYASEHGHFEAVKWIYTTSREISRSKCTIVPSICLAMENGHVDIAKYLYHKIDLTRSAYQKFCLSIAKASQNGHSNIIDWVVLYGGI